MNTSYLLIDQCQQMGHDLSSYVSTITNYSLAAIKLESLYQLMYRRFICYKLKVIDVIYKFYVSKYAA